MELLNIIMKTALVSELPALCGSSLHVVLVTVC